jgi:integrase
MYTELTQGTYVAEKNTTFKEFSERWISIYEASGRVKISTVRVRRHEMGNLTPYFEHLKMKDITKKRYQDALNDLMKKGFADNTLDGIHGTGRTIFKKAVSEDIIKIDPTQFAFVPKVQKTVEELESEKEIPKYLEKEELALFLKTAYEMGLDRDYQIFKTLAFTGIRVGELCAMKNSDIDHVEHTINITKTYYNPTNNTVKYHLLPPKTKSSFRKIEVDPDLLKVLDDYRKEQNVIRMKFRDRYHDKDFTFAKTEKNPGYPELTKTIENRMARLLKLAGLNTDLTTHSLRHSHCSLLAEAGVSLETITERLGHQDDEVTRIVYLHVTKPQKKEASQKFAELMRSL